MVARLVVSHGPHTAASQMDFGGYLQHWQQVFAVTYPSSNHLLSILSVILVLIGFSAFTLKFKNFEVNSKSLSAKVYKEQNTIAKLFDYILQALSKGILNSRFYNVSYVTR